MSVQTEQYANTTISTLIAPHLPYLRRYARALCGNQTSGDAYVAQVLEALIEDQSLFDRSLGPRTALYRLFTAIWTSVQVGGSDVGDPQELAERAIARLAPRSRQVLLLLNVEEFTEQETAAIIDVSLEEVQTLKRDVTAELSAQAQARVMIIEDEPVIALDLESIVGGMGHMVVGIADTHASAVELAEETTPDLILADIQLADGSSGIDAVEEILTSATVPVVFITAFPERLLTGERPEPTFLVTKPFRPQTVEAAISQVLFHKDARAA